MTAETHVSRIGRSMTKDERIAVLEQGAADLRQIAADLREEIEARLRPAAPELTSAEILEGWRRRLAYLRGEDAQAQRPRLTLVDGEGGEA